MKQPIAASGESPLRTRAWPLSFVLAGLSVLLVLGTAVGVSTIAALLLRRLADQQAIARIELAGRAARETVERAEQETVTAARVLADRPTLARLLGSGGSGLDPFLARFCAPAGYEACAVVDGESVLAVSPAGYPLPAPHAAGLSVQRSPSGGVAIVAAARVPGDDRLAVVVHALDDAFAARLSEHVGMAVRIAPWDSMAVPATPGPIRQGGEIRSAVPLAVGGGDRVARLEVALPRTEVDRSIRTLVGTLLVATVFVVAIAAASAIVVGRLIARPLLSLADSARRIGAGDLATPVRIAPGEEAGRLAGTMEDMRRRLLRLTAELRRSQSEARALLDGVVEGVFAVDERRTISYVNAQAAALLGIEPAEAIGRFCGDVLHPEPRNGVRPCDARCPIVHARSRGSTRATEIVQLKDGRRRTVVVTSSEPSEGRQVQVVRDETDIEGARRARDAIIANVSHEFRTPLAAQLASLELLRGAIEQRAAGEDVDAGAAELVRAAERSSLRLVQLVDNLLESVRVDAGEDAIRRRPVALDELIDEATALMAPLLQQRAQQVDISLPYPVPPLQGDAQRLTQVLVNLLANASKYAPEESVLRIGVTAADGSVSLWVDDSGPGIPAGAERTLFEPFVRAADADTGGMGLGLWIVKSIVQRHGGTVHARSLPDGGSRFTVTLPAPGQ
jgi:PAS domain S-box-containing protein